MELATAAQMKRVDETAIQGRGIPSTLLMERAAQGILAVACALAGEGRPGRGPGPCRAAVFAGPGNNGGDGVAVASLLRKAGWEVRAFLAGDRARMTPDCREMERRLAELGGALEDYVPGDAGQEDFARSADVLVDALFGVGLNAPLREPAASAAELMNRCPAPVVAADIPSGVEADTGRVLGAAVAAAATVTFSRGKPGLFVGKGALHAGRVTVHDIGIPADLLEAERPLTCAVTADMVRAWLPVRPADGHKGTFGKVYALAGSVGYTGAPVLATRAAARSGAGLVFLDVPEEVYPIVAAKCDEVMPRPLAMGRRGLETGTLGAVLERVRRCDAVLAGPGLEESQAAAELLYAILEHAACPVVLDAGGLNLAAAHMDMVDARHGPLILTPHDGEFARLGGDLSQGDRLAAARAFARAHRCILVLKGHGTIVAHPDGRAAVNTTGNSGMAKGGSGDVLSGMLLALLGGGMEPFRAAASAVFLHGLAGDLCAERLGEWGMLPGDMIGEIPRAFQTVLRG